MCTRVLVHGSEFLGLRAASSTTSGGWISVRRDAMEALDFYFQPRGGPSAVPLPQRAGRLCFPTRGETTVQMVLAGAGIRHSPERGKHTSVVLFR